MYLSAKDKLIYLMQSTDTTVINCLAKFIYVGFKVHNHFCTHSCIVTDLQATSAFLSLKFIIYKVQSYNLDAGTLTLERGRWNVDSRTWTLECQHQNLDAGTSTLEHGRRSNVQVLATL